MTDPIADMLTRIRNIILVGKTEVSVPSSKIKLDICAILKHEGYIADFSASKAFPSQITIRLESNAGTYPITSLVRVSKPGRRIYSGSHDIPRVLSGHGIMIISTPKGLMTDREARKQGLGGELVCKIW